MNALRISVIVVLFAALVTACSAFGTPTPHPNIAVEPLIWTEWITWGASGSNPIRPQLEIHDVQPDKTYQFKTEYGAHGNGWRDGSLTYYYKIPKNLQPIIRGRAGDTAVRFCWEGGPDYNILVMKTRKGNGTSGGVSFVKTDTNPPDDQKCPLPPPSE